MLSKFRINQSQQTQLRHPDVVVTSLKVKLVHVQRFGGGTSIEELPRPRSIQEVNRASSFIKVADIGCVMIHLLYWELVSHRSENIVKSVQRATVIHDILSSLKPHICQSNLKKLYGCCRVIQVELTY